MSTKIYTAWRVPLSKLATFMQVYDRIVLGNFVKLRGLTQMNAVPASEIESAFNKSIGRKMAELKWPIKGQKRNRQIFDRWYRCYKLGEWLRTWPDKLREKENSSIRDELMYIAQQGFKFWIYQKHAYITPFGESEPNSIKQHQKLIKAGAEEYGYWNNTDKPDHVHWRSWRRRGIVWDTILQHGFDAYHKRFFHYTIDVTYSMGGSVLVDRLGSEFFGQNSFYKIQNLLDVELGKKQAQIQTEKMAKESVS